MECRDPKFDKKTGKPLTEETPVVEEAVVAESAKPAESNQTFTMTQLLEILQEMKKPNEVEQFRYDQEKQKIADEHANRLRLAERARENAERADRIRSQGQAFCVHQKENGTTAFAGQVNSDGNTRFMCIRCGKVEPPVKAPDDWKTGGVNTQMGADVSGAMRFINERMIMDWHRMTHPNCKMSCCVRELMAV